MKHLIVCSFTFISFDSSLAWEILWNPVQDLQGFQHLMSNMEPFFFLLFSEPILTPAYYFLNFLLQNHQMHRTLKIVMEIQGLILSLEILQT